MMFTNNPCNPNGVANEQIGKSLKMMFLNGNGKILITVKFIYSFVVLQKYSDYIELPWRRQQITVLNCKKSC